MKIKRCENFLMKIKVMVTCRHGVNHNKLIKHSLLITFKSLINYAARPSLSYRSEEKSR